MNQQTKRIVEVAALAGEIMLESHAESYRVEDTVRRILAMTGMSSVEVVTTTTALYFTIDDEDPRINPVSIIRRIDHRGNHLNKIYRVNNISRMFTAGTIDTEEAYRRLTVVDESEYSVRSMDFATIMIVMSFTILGGGNLAEVIVSILLGTIVALSRVWKNFIDMNDFIFTIITTLSTAFVATLIADHLPYSVSSHIMIIGALMPLYPGTAFTNGIRDTLKGDYVSGVARMADAFVIAISIALGVASGLALYKGVEIWL